MILINYLLFFSFDQAIQLDPKNSSVWDNKGYALNDLGKYEEAVNW